MEENPNMPSSYQVHHSLPQEYEDLFEDSEINIHDVEYLRGVPRSIHTHITNLWRMWKKSKTDRATKDEVIEFAEFIDKLFKGFWY